MIRQRVKGMAEALLTRGPGLRALLAQAAGSTVVMAWHNVIPDEEPLTGIPSLHFRFGEFRRALDLLQEFTAIIPLDALGDRETAAPGTPSVERRKRDRHDRRPRVVLTFDDAYAGLLQVGLPELASRNLPATIFVPTGLVGSEAFWWDALGLSGWEGSREPLLECRGEAPRVREWAGRRGRSPSPQAAGQRPPTEEALLRAAHLPGITFGVHTVSHPNLATLAPEEQLREIGDSLAWLHARSLPVSPWIAYPYGILDEGTVEAARSAGLLGGLTTTPGRVEQGVDRFRVPRVLVPAGASSEGVLLRALGAIRS